MNKMIEGEEQELESNSIPAGKNQFVDQPLLSGEPFSIKSHWTYKVVGWFGLFFWIAMIIWELGVGIFDTTSVYIFGLMITINILLLILARTSIFIDQNSIVIVRAFGRYQIKWDEIEKIVFDTKMQKVVFCGQDKWLVMPRVVPHVSGRRFGIADYVNAQVRARKVHVEFSESTPERSRNTLTSIF